MLDYLIFIGLWSIVTYLLCRYYYNKGFDEGSKYTSRVIGVSSVKKNKKNIYGKASIEDVEELKEEGIETSTIPWIEDKEN